MSFNQYMSASQQTQSLFTIGSFQQARSHNSNTFSKNKLSHTNKVIVKCNNVQPKL